MSDAVIISIVAVVGILIPVLGGIITLFINRWFNKMDEKLDKYHEQVNGNMQKLLKVSGDAENAKGNLEGRKELKNEQDIDNNKT